MDNLNTRIVDFHAYCSSCVHRDDDETTHPCDDCLTIPARENSRKPEYYKRKEDANA